MTEPEWLVSDNLRAVVYYLAGGSQGLEGHNDSWHVSARKLRLFSCAVARSRWHLLGLVAQGCVEVAECRADGLASSKDRGEAFNRADLLRDFEGTLARACLRANAASGAYDLTSAMTDSTGKIHRLWCDILRDIVGNPYRPVVLPPSPDRCKLCRGKGKVSAGPGGQMVGLLPLKCCGACSGRGFRSHPWLTPQVLSLAQAAYDERPERKCEACGGVGCVRDENAMFKRGKCPGNCSDGRIDDGTLDPDRLAILADCLEEASCANIELLEHLRSNNPHVRGCWALDLILGKN